MTVRPLQPRVIPTREITDSHSRTVAQLCYLLSDGAEVPEPRDIDREVGRQPGDLVRADSTYERLLARGYYEFTIGLFDREHFATLPVDEALAYLRQFYKWTAKQRKLFTPEHVARLQVQIRDDLARRKAEGWRYDSETRQPTIDDVRKLLDEGYYVTVTAENKYAVLVWNYDSTSGMFEIYGYADSGVCEQLDADNMKLVVDFLAGIVGYRR
jgi:hypothetical protein